MDTRGEEAMTLSPAGTVSTTVYLNREAREFLDRMAPGKTKGLFLTGLLLQEHVRVEYRTLEKEGQAQNTGSNRGPPMSATADPHPADPHLHDLGRKLTLAEV